MKADKTVEFAPDRMLQLSVWQRGTVIGNTVTHRSNSNYTNYDYLYLMLALVDINPN